MAGVNCADDEYESSEETFLLRQEEEVCRIQVHILAWKLRRAQSKPTQKLCSETTSQGTVDTFQADEGRRDSKGVSSGSSVSVIPTEPKEVSPLAWDPDRKDCKVFKERYGSHNGCLSEGADGRQKVGRRAHAACRISL
eukprot:TRINITY_DN71519_c0_g1_i1.p2 TRINITY_DN71519_c0_g1~~TRINITY_DN71519_c0_g1_i1.p2  ORF type:complete len:139 (-),score=13.43 TRINITY_DN71519_c0_g1_i1:94-510(-)